MARLVCDSNILSLHSWMDNYNGSFWTVQASQEGFHTIKYQLGPYFKMLPVINHLIADSYDPIPRSISGSKFANVPWHRTPSISFSGVTPKLEPRSVSEPRVQSTSGSRFGSFKIQRTRSIVRSKSNLR